MNTIEDVIIIGTSHHNTYSMVRCFSEKKISPNVILYGCEKSYISHSKCIKSILFVPTAIDVINFIKGKQNIVIISCTDEISSKLDLHFDTLENICFFNAGERGRVTFFMDKERQVKLAQKVGLSVPWSYSFYINEIDTKNISFPCIIKPLESINGGKNIQIAQSQEEFFGLINNYDGSQKVLVQEFVNREYEIVLLGLAVNNEVNIPAYIKKHRDIKGGTTYSTVKTIDSLPKELVESAKNMLLKIGYEGLFGIELIKSKDKFYFIELNLRNDATTYSLTCAGVNLPYAYFLAKEGLDYKKEINKDIKEINSMVEFNDIVNVLKTQVPLIQWINEWWGSECRYCYSREDKRVYYIQLRDFFINIIKRIFRR